MGKDKQVEQDELVLAEMEDSTSSDSPSESEDTQDSEESTQEVETQEDETSESDEEVEVTEEDEESESDEETEPEEDDGSLQKEKEDEIPFNQRPEFQDRIKEIEDKYGQKAQTFDALMSRARTEDPELFLKTVKILEESGEYPTGTYELARQQVQIPQKENQGEGDNQADVAEVVKNLPEVRYARELKQKAEREQEEFLANYENRHPEIAQSKNPEQTRNSIASVAQMLVANEGMAVEDAMEDAFDIVVNRGRNTSKKTKEQAELEAKYQAKQKTVANTNASKNVPKKKVKVTAKQKSAAESLGMSIKEYLKWSSPDSGMVD